jgi:hypothetical protein
VAALADAEARRDVAALAADPGVWLGADEAPFATAVAARAARATAALAGTPLARPADARAALAAAGRLFEAGLFFEAHEVLEPHWAVATEPLRGVLQGVIQVAAGCHHLASGNLAGARSLLAEGAARLHGRRALDVDFDAFARAAAAAAAAGPAATPPAFPRVCL